MKHEAHPTPLSSEDQVKQGAPWKLVKPRKTRTAALRLEIVRLNKLVRQLEGSIKVDIPKPGTKGTQKQGQVAKLESGKSPQLVNGKPCAPLKVPAFLPASPQAQQPSTSTCTTFPIGKAPKPVVKEVRAIEGLGSQVPATVATVVESRTRAIEPQQNRKQRRLQARQNNGAVKELAKDAKSVAPLSQHKQKVKKVGITKSPLRATNSHHEKKSYSSVSGPETGGKPSSAASIRATPAKPPPDVVSAVAGPTVRTQRQSIAIDATPKPVTKRFPRTAGTSRLATLDFNDGREPAEDDLSTLPVKGMEEYVERAPVGRPSHGLFGWRKVRGIEELKRRQQCKLDVDKELYGYLIYTFMLQARTPEVMSQMASKTKQFLAGFDLTDYSWEHLHKVSVRAITAAMNVPSDEVDICDQLANLTAGKERKRHADVVREGKVAKPERNMLQNLFSSSSGGLASKNK